MLLEVAIDLGENRPSCSTGGNIRLWKGFVMARVNIIVSKKGGVGKSLIAAMVGEYLTEKRAKAKMSPPVLIDLDPTNATFSSFEALNVSFLEVMSNDDIDRRKFDALVEQICKAAKDDVFLIDTGSNAYISLMGYMVQNAVPDLLLAAGHEVVIHVPIMGGAELIQTMECLKEVGEKIPKAALIAVWLNTKNGSIEYMGTAFENSDTYKTVKDRVRSVTTFYEWRADMATDIAETLKVGKTFNEAAQDPSAAIMVRQRMTMARRYMFERIEASRVCE